jgi:putative ABC transport system permease protein
LKSAGISYGGTTGQVLLTSTSARPSSRARQATRTRPPSQVSDVLQPARMRPGDVAKVGAVGLRTRPLRAFLSALGTAIGITAMVGVVGISPSSRADLDRALAALGTNLLTVTLGRR